MRKWIISSIIISCSFLANQKAIAQTNTYTIPTAGNSFEIDYQNHQNSVKKDGILINASIQNKTSVYFKINNSGRLTIKLKGTAKNSGKLAAKIENLNQVINFNPNQSEYLVGETTLNQPKYYHLDLSSLSGEILITDIILEGEATKKGVTYSDDPNYFYWSRRGPSCHLKYEIPTENNVSYYYSEISVPKGQDVNGSYFMANGFSEGYFGIQVNSETERRVLFSVWSPYQTDNPKEIPEEDQIKLLKKGQDVYVGEFGNEGSGGQSYLRYNWRPDTHYKFLLKASPDGQNNTIYTAWFFAPEVAKWQLIASFKRPKTNTYLKGFHSFLENFNPNQGYLTRSANYTNQWVYDGAWKKVNSATFTVDATYKANQRVDAVGGITSEGYYLRMGGFFSDYVKPNSIFNYTIQHKAPSIQLDALP